jgi:hypothetical protein
MLQHSTLNAQTVAALAESDDYIFRASNSSSGTFQEMIMDDPSANDGTKESDPFIAWIPTDTASGGQLNYTILSSSTSMPNITAAVANIHLRLLIQVNNTSGTAYFIYGGAHDGSSTFSLFTTSATSLGNDQWQIDINFGLAQSGLCVEIGTECTSFLSLTDGTREDEFLFYIYATFDSTVPSPGSTVDPGGAMSGGTYYKLKISDKIPTGNLSLDTITKGDAQLTLNYSNGSSIGNMIDGTGYKTVIFDYNVNLTNNTPQSAGINIGTARATHNGQIYSLENFSREGSISAQKLTNDREYNLAVALVNKYQFASQLSLSLVETPIEIETLLKENQCYLVTAGFQKEHYILDYFRHIRDSILLKSSWGSQFVEFYYSTAPDYAPIIYNSKWLSGLVRTASYGLYYVMKVYPILIFLCLMIFAIRYKRKNPLK